MIGKTRSKISPSKNRGRAPFWVQDVLPRSVAVEEKVTTLFQPDILVSAQYHAACQRRFQLDPERVLMLAILQDAVVCFQDHVAAKCKRKQILHREAEEWILDKDRIYLFSFENVCDALGYDADYLRGGLLRWKRQMLRSESAASGRHALGRVGA